MKIPFRLTLLTAALATACIAQARSHSAPTADSSDSTNVEWPADMASMTLPIVYVTTCDSLPVTDKVNAKAATLRIMVPDGVEGTPLGSEESPVAMTIRGRGNSSWLLPKKPYKIKFDQKTAVLGMPKNKHFALMSYATGYADWLTAVAGFEFSRLIGLEWAPQLRPVELVVNGSYEGLYFLTETVRIDSNRLDIYEQDDMNTDESTIPYGWLVEMDNTIDECQITIPETPEMDLRITYHTPEELSAEQTEWLTDEFTKINASIYQPDSLGSKWTDHIDAESLVKYFTVREALHDCEGFSGSVYLHRDKGEDSKWKFGPVWDLVIYSTDKNDWARYSMPEYAEAHWINPIAATDTFATTFKQLWSEIYPDILPKLQEAVDKMAEQCLAADSVNTIRWEFLSRNYQNRARWVNEALANNMQWIDEHVDMVGTSGIDFVKAPTAPDTPISITVIGRELFFKNVVPDEYALTDLSGRTLFLSHPDAASGRGHLPEEIGPGVYLLTARSPHLPSTTIKIRL